MSVHYKFKSSLDYDTVTFDGLHISVGDLKKSILQQKKIGKGFDFDLQITNAQTKEVYVEDGTLIPKNASVIVSRVPNSLASKKSWDRNDSSNLHAAVGNVNSESLPFDKATKTADLVSMNASESDKILAMMSQSTQDYDPSRYGKTKAMTGPLPPSYTCFRCGQSGHWIKNCPTNSMDVKRSTGIPRSFMVTVEGPKVPGALLTSTGHYAVPMIDHEAYKEGKKERPPFSKEESPEKEPAPEIPEDLLCVICKDLLTDAVITPCCGNSYCDECVRQALLDSDDHECPTCHVKDVSPDTLIPIRLLRNSVLKFKNQTGYTKVKKVTVFPTTVNPEQTVSEPVLQPPPLDEINIKIEPVVAVGSPRSPCISATVVSAAPAEEKHSVELPAGADTISERVVELVTSPKCATPEPAKSAESPVVESAVTDEPKVEPATSAPLGPIDKPAAAPERTDSRVPKPTVPEPLMSKIIADPPFIPRNKEQDCEVRRSEPDFDTRRSISRDRRPAHRPLRPDGEDDRKLYPHSGAEHPGTPVRDEYGVLDYPADGGRYPPNYRHEHQYHDNYGVREEPPHTSETYTIQTVLTTRGDWQPDDITPGSYQMPQPAPLLDPNSRNSRDPHHLHHHHHHQQQQQQQQHITRKDNNQTSHLMPIDVSNITGTPVPVVSQSARDEQTQLSVAYAARTGPPGTHPIINAPPGTYSASLPLGGRPGGPAAPPPHLMSLSTPGAFDVRHPPPNVPLPSLFHAPPPSLLRRPPMLPPPGTGPHMTSAGQPLPPGVVPPPSTSTHGLPPPPGDPYQQHPYPPPHQDPAYMYGGGHGFGDRDRSNRDPLDVFARELFEYQREGRRPRRRSSSSRSYSSRSSYSRSSRSRSHSSRSRSYSSRSRSKSYSRSRSRSQYSRRTRSATRSRTRSPRSRSRSPKHSPPPHKKKSRSPPLHKRRPSPSGSISRRHPDFIPAPGSNYYGGGGLYRGGPPPAIPNVPPVNNPPYDVGRGRYGGDPYGRYDNFHHHQFEHHSEEAAAAAAHQYDMRDSRYGRGGGNGGYPRYDEYYRGGYQRHPQHHPRVWQSGPGNLMDVRGRPGRDMGRRGGRGGGMGVDPAMMKPPIMDKTSLMPRERGNPGRGQDYGGVPNRGQEYIGAGRSLEYAGPNRGGPEYPPSHRSEYHMHHRGQDYSNRGHEYSGGRMPPEYGSNRGHHDYGAATSMRSQDYAGDQRSSGSSRGQDYGGGDQRSSGTSRNQDYGSSFGRGTDYSSSRGGAREPEKPQKHHDDLNGGKDTLKENFKPRDSSKESRSLRKKSSKSGAEEEPPRASNPSSTNTKSSVGGTTTAAEKAPRSSSVEKSREKKHKRKTHHTKDEPAAKKVKTSKNKGSAEADPASSAEVDASGSRSSSSKKSTRKKKKRSKEDDGGGSDAATGKSRSSPKSSRRHKGGDDVGTVKEEKRTSRETVSDESERRSRVAETSEVAPRETVTERETSPATTSFAEGEDAPIEREDVPEMADEESKLETEEDCRAHSADLGSEAPEEEGDGRPDSEQRSEMADPETEGDEEHRESPMDDGDADNDDEDDPEEEEPEDDESVLMAPVPELSKWERDDVEASRPDESSSSAYSAQQQHFRQAGKKSLPPDILHKAEKAILFHKARLPNVEGAAKGSSSNRKIDGGAAAAGAATTTEVTPERETTASATAVATEDAEETESAAKDRSADRVKLDRSKFTDRPSPKADLEAPHEVEAVASNRKKSESTDETSADEETHDKRNDERDEQRRHRGHHHSSRTERYSDRGRSDDERHHHRHRHHDSRDRERPSHRSRREERDRSDVRRGGSREKLEIRHAASRDLSYTRQDDRERLDVRRGGSRERSDVRRGGSRDRSDGRRGSSRERVSQRHDSRDRSDLRRGGSRDRVDVKRGGSRDRVLVVKTDDRDRSSGRHSSRERPSNVKSEERPVTATKQDDRRRDYTRRNPSPPSSETRDHSFKDGSRITNREVTPPQRVVEDKSDRSSRKMVEEQRPVKQEKYDRTHVRGKSGSDEENFRGGGDKNKDDVVERRESVKIKGSTTDLASNVRDDSDSSRRRQVRRLSSTIDESKFEPNYDEGGAESDHESISRTTPSTKPTAPSVLPAAVATKVSSAPPVIVKEPMAVKRHRSSSSVPSSSSSQSGDESSSPSKKPVKESHEKHSKHKKSKHKKSKHKKNKKKSKKKNKKKDEEKPVKSSVVKH